MLTDIQLRCQTQYTKTGVRDMKNRKPYRTKQQKRMTQDPDGKHYRRVDKDGAYRSSAPVSYHH